MTDEMKRALELANLAEAARLRGDTVYFDRDERGTLARALLASQAECERMRAVYEAAVRWRDARPGFSVTIESDLMNAIDAARTNAATHDSGQESGG